MHLNENIKASLALTLTCLSEDLELRQIKMYKANNSSIYTISSRDKSVDLTINFRDLSNINSTLNTILNYFNSEQPTNVRTDEQFLADACDILNIYSSEFISVDEEPSPLSTKLSNYFKTFNPWIDDANITTSEGSSLICTTALLHNLMNGYYFTPETTHYAILEELKIFEEDTLETLIEWNHNNWLNRESQEITDKQIKDEINLCTLLTSTELMPCSFGYSTVVDNIGGVKYSPTILDLHKTLKFPQEKQYLFHNKEGIEEELQEFKRDIYSILFGSFGKITKPIKDTDEYDNQLNIISSQYNENSIPVLCDLYREFYPHITPRMQKVLEGTILNHASLQGLTIQGLPHLNIEDLTYDRLNDITDINYDYLSSPQHRHILNSILEYGFKEWQRLSKAIKAAEALQTTETNYDENEDIPPLSADGLFKYLDSLTQFYENKLKEIKDKKDKPSTSPEDDHTSNK